MPIRILKTAEPTAPPVDRVWLYVDESDGRFKQKNPDGSIIIFSVGTQITSETIVLTPQMINDKAFTLVHTPDSVRSVLVVPAGGPPQLPEIDFNIIGSQLIWSGLGLDGILEAGDLILIHYSWS
jgi:hypothetical protein